ncbi:MAG: hypothetical protein L0Y72_15930 [Gemmataceae bacterium]|nr:hypothetical protein [Gemmataceae bacterium]MCI0740537.1 hypothetical protein [Gemmataceae bacterium]
MNEKDKEKLIGACCFIGVVAILLIVGNLLDRTATDQFGVQYDSGSGKPVTMPQGDWKELNEIVKHGTGFSEAEAQEVVRGVWGVELARKARNGK